MKLALVVLCLVPGLAFAADCPQGMEPSTGNPSACVAALPLTVRAGYRDDQGHFLFLALRDKAYWGTEDAIHPISASESATRYESKEWGSAPYFFDDRLTYNKAKNTVSAEERRVSVSSTDGKEFAFDCKGRKFTYKPMSREELERVLSRVSSGKMAVKPSESRPVRRPQFLLRGEGNVYYYMDVFKDQSGKEVPRLIKGTKGNAKEVGITEYDRSGGLSWRTFDIKTAEGEAIYMDLHKEYWVRTREGKRDLQFVYMHEFDLRDIGVSFEDVRYKDSEIHTPCDPVFAPPVASTPSEQGAAQAK